MSEQPESKEKLHFLEQIVSKDLESKHIEQLVTRFPPEPNGFLHIGHAKSICLNFGMAERFNGRCNLRFDDTNPLKEDQSFIEAIIEDVRWLGYQWDGEVRYASSYFDTLFEWAKVLINDGLAYVCHLSPDQAREYRGTLTEPGVDSPYRNRGVEENLAEFEKMRAGEYDEGACVLRAKIDMAHPNMVMRDPILYRIMKRSHHQTGDKWCIYPTYDFAHGQEDAIEGITHSFCSLEFADHRPLYDWFIEHLPVPHKPRQYEFGRLNVSYAVTSKRKVKQLIDDGIVESWDDPRLPTIAGLRRRGYTARALRKFCEMVGVSRSDGLVDVGMLEHAIRDDLDKNAPRAMCVISPLKVTLSNYPDDASLEITAPGHPSREDLPSRKLTFSNTVWIDEADFQESANKKYKRLVLGKRVRLRHAYVIEAYDCVKDDSGRVIEVKAKIIEDSLGQDPADGVKAKGVIHWVDDKTALRCKVNLYDRLFTDPSPDSGDKNFLELINPDSLMVQDNALCEPSLANAKVGEAYQFEREGYFCLDPSSSDNELIFNRTIGLKDTWEKH